MNGKNRVTSWIFLVNDRLKKNSNAEMSFFDHLAVLRQHLLRSVIAIVIFTTWGLTYFDFVFDKIILGPKREDFLTYRILCAISRQWGLDSKYCLKEIKFNIINTELAGQFTLQINSSVIIGLILAFPYLLFELWLFIKPALTDVERNAVKGFVFYSSLLFGLGILFGYYIIAPYSIRFLADFHLSEAIQNQISIDSYFSSLTTLTLGSGFIFELPIIVFILAKIGLLSPAIMRTSRRYAVIIMLVLSAIVTPTPDMQTMLIVFFPLMILYEISIGVAWKIERKKVAGL